jgi:hypothetical protein
MIGILNADDVLALLTELKAATDFYNEQDQNWKARLCNITTNEFVKFPQRTASMLPVGEGGTPLRQRIDFQTVQIPDPGRWGIGSAVTQVAIEEGIDEETIRQNHTDALNADYRLITRLCLRAMLMDGGWWDGTATPPNWASNTFDATHTHYIAANAAGLPTLAHWTTIKRHIQEHGFGLEEDGGVVAVINGDMASRIEATAEYVQTDQPMRTRAMEALQWYGLVPEFRAAGVWVTQSDWVPDNYIAAWALNEKPLHWRIPKGMEGADRLLSWESPENVRVKGSFDYIRRGSTAVTLRGAGVAAYLGGASWVDADISLYD